MSFERWSGLWLYVEDKIEGIFKDVQGFFFWDLRCFECVMNYFEMKFKMIKYFGWC